MNNTTLTESMSSLKQRLQLIESETTNEAGGTAGERAAEKFGLNAAKQALRNTANKARERLANKIAPSAEKVAPAADKVAPAAEKGGYVPATRDSTAVNGLNAEQKQLSDYFAKPENHVTKDGKVYGRDPNKVGEFVELDSKTLLPKGDIGVNRQIFHANGPLNQELQALEKLGPQEVQALENKALTSALTDAEKAEVKSGGIINWIKNNPKRAAALGLLAGIVAAGTIASLMASDDEQSTVADKPTTTTTTTTQITPQQAEQQILAIIAELEKEPACAEDVAKIKAELARIKSGQVATPPAPDASGTIAGKPTTTTASQPYEVKPGDNLTKIAQQMGTTLPELLKANPQYQKNPNLIHPGEKINPPVAAPVAKPAEPAQKLSGTPTIPANVAESDELARWLKIARG
jgi:LysM repeat protein